MLWHSGNRFGVDVGDVGNGRESVGTWRERSLKSFEINIIVVQAHVRHWYVRYGTCIHRGGRCSGGRQRPALDLRRSQKILTSRRKKR